tara:strand:- start:1315 stop:2511 length:1197 start_codon:yes stop_codon:yes gene_type:complete
MADSTILNLDLQTTGSNAGTWGTVTNENLEKVEKGIKGYKAVSVAGSGTTSLTVASGTSGTSDEQSRASLKFTGTLTGNKAIECEAVETWYFIDDGSNRGAGPYSLTFGPAGGTPVTLVATTGSKYIIYTDGTTAFDVLADAGNIKAGGTLTTVGNVSFDTGTLTFNTSEGNYDARFAGDSETNLLYIDASTDRVGINTATPGKDLDVVGTFRASGNTDIDGGTFTFNTTEADLDARFAGATETNLLYLDASADKIGIKIAAPTSDLHVAGTMKVTGAADFDGGSFIWNEAGADLDLRLESLNLENMLVVDGSADKIGIGVASPADARMEINQTDTTGAIACLSLDQDDNDQPFLFFEGDEQSDTTGNITTGSVGAITKYVRVKIGTTSYWMPLYATS